MVGIAHASCCNPRVKFRAQISLQPICAQGREVHARKWDIDTFPIVGSQSRYQRVVLNAKIIAAATIGLRTARDAALLDFRQLITTCNSVVQYRWLNAARGRMEVPRRTLSCRQGRRTALLVAGGANHCLTNIAIGLGIGRIEPEYQALPFCTYRDAISPQTLSSTLASSSMQGVVLPIDPVSFPPKPSPSTHTPSTLAATSQMLSHVSTSAVAPFTV